MIVSKTPLRISFFCGGSDAPYFYELEGGRALSATIDKYTYVCLSEAPNACVRVMYDRTQDEERVEKIRHAIAREALLKYGVRRELTISSMSDIRVHGAGLGSSSSYTVGLVSALRRLTGQFPGFVERNSVAEDACDIEISRCGYPIGKQDQYAAAWGGVNYMRFLEDGSVTCTSTSEMVDGIARLKPHLTLLFSGISRDAAAILERQKAEVQASADKLARVRRNRDRATQGARLLSDGTPEDFGRLLHEAWQDKREAVSGMTNEYFDRVYEAARESGAWGGKLLGAGGGGFFLFCSPEDTAARLAGRLESEFTACKAYDFSFSFSGAIVTEV